MRCRSYKCLDVVQRDGAIVGGHLRLLLDSNQQLVSSVRKLFCKEVFMLNYPAVTKLLSFVPQKLYKNNFIYIYIYIYIYGVFIFK